MAKVPFSKLQASVSNYVHHNTYLNKSGEEVTYEVKQYLPMQEKLEMITRIINYAVDDNGFYNPMRVKFFMTLEVVYTYTNLTFTEKMKEDQFKLYDILVSTGIFNDVLTTIGEREWADIQKSVWDTINNIYQYHNSAMGVLEALKSDYSNLNFDLEALQQNISNPENLTLLKQILNMSGLKE